MESPFYLKIKKNPALTSPRNECYFPPVRAFSLCLFAILGLSWGVCSSAWPTPSAFSGLTALFPAGSTPPSTDIPGKARVWVFLSTRCPCSKSHLGKLKRAFEEFSAKGIQFFGVHSNQDEMDSQAPAYFKEANLGFSVYQDPQADLANHFGALKTPHVFIESSDHKILYQGGIDNSKSADSTTANYLRDALTQIHEGKKISQPLSRSLGCLISRRKKP